MHPVSVTMLDDILKNTDFVFQPNNENVIKFWVSREYSKTYLREKGIPGSDWSFMESCFLDV